METSWNNLCTYCLCTSPKKMFRYSACVRQILFKISSSSPTLFVKAFFFLLSPLSSLISKGDFKRGKTEREGGGQKLETDALIRRKRGGERFNVKRREEEEERHRGRREEKLVTPQLLPRKHTYFGFFFLAAFGQRFQCVSLSHLLRC